VQPHHVHDEVREAREAVSEAFEVSGQIQESGAEQIQ
jgi:hypothetical protein